MDKIKEGKYVALVYDIYEVATPKDVLMFQFTEKYPDKFVFGMDAGMLPGFMDNLRGLAAGDKFDFVLSPEEAFGPYLENYVQSYPRSTFEVDGEFQADVVKVGATIQMLTQDGHRVDGDVLEVGDEMVKIDFNHPLAGQSIHYIGEVKEVRDATVEELNPKHGCGGCSCGCDHDHDHGCDCGSCVMSLF